MIHVVFCFFVCLQLINAQCLGGCPGYGNFGGFDIPYPANLPAPGMNICSDNLIIEGPVCIQGRVPFVGTVAVEGSFPTTGCGAVAYGCGDGVGISDVDYGRGYYGRGY